MATTQEQLDVVKAQVAQLATKQQWQQLMDLLTTYKSNTDTFLATYLARIESLEAEVHSLKQRVYDLENP